jgi:hypothetical protein
MTSAFAASQLRLTDFASGRSAFAEATAWLANRGSRECWQGERRLVRKRGFEPPRSCDRQPLKLVRLPFRHFREEGSGIITEHDARVPSALAGYDRAVMVP